MVETRCNESVLPFWSDLSPTQLNGPDPKTGVREEFLRGVERKKDKRGSRGTEEEIKAKLVCGEEERKGERERSRKKLEGKLRRKKREWVEHLCPSSGARYS